jgi:hypothetical protein
VPSQCTTRDVRREHAEQALQIAGFDRLLERFERISGLGTGNDPAWSADGGVPTGPVDDWRATRRLGGRRVRRSESFSATARFIGATSSLIMQGLMGMHSSKL